MVVAYAMVAARPEPVYTKPIPPSILVQVGEIEMQQVVHTVNSQGTVAPRTQTSLVAEAQGQIVEVSPDFVSGGFFRKGDTLLKIDPRNYAATVKRARADVARARTQLETESALAGYAAKDYERLLAANPDKGPASSLALRRPQLKEASAVLQSAQADLEKALGDLDRTIIRAPYNGLVREKIADVGQYVSPGTQIGKTFAVDVAEIRLPVTQHDLQFLDLAKIRSNEPLAVTLRANIAGVATTWHAHITRSEGVFDAASRVLYLVAQLPDPYGLTDDDNAPLLVGTFVDAEIEGQDAGELAVIPRHALQRGTTLWMVDDDLKIFPREVVVARRDDRYVYISSGVKPGERYCLNQIEQPLPGMQVRVSDAL